jgi:hypothetical protein
MKMCFPYYKKKNLKAGCSFAVREMGIGKQQNVVMAIGEHR